MNNSPRQSDRPTPSRRPFAARFAAAISTATLALLVLAPSASASKQPIDFFGGAGVLGGQFSGAEGFAVNNSGAGGVPAGTVYVADGGSFDVPSARGNRVERFTRNDNGTPADTTDDTYEFISAWGAGVESGGTDYEICAVAANCSAGKGIGGNGTLAGDGAFSKPSSVAVDQDTGDVYVLDAGSRRTEDDNFRVNVYTAAGTFLRSFGWDVVASGPDDNGTGYEVCKAGADVCKAGAEGVGVGQMGAFENGERAPESIAVSPPDGNSASGTVFLADQHNHRVNTYNLDASSPSSFGSATQFPEGPYSVAVDSRGIVYASTSTSIQRYDSQNADGGGVGFLASIAFTGGSSALAVEPDSDGAGPDSDILYAEKDPNAGEQSLAQFGPADPPGLTTPPAIPDETHATSPKLENLSGIAADETTGSLYATALRLSSGFEGTGVYVINAAGAPPTATLDSLSNVTSHSLVAHATIDPNGPPNTEYHFEYSINGVHWKSTPTVVLGHQEAPQSVEATIEPPPVGLDPATLYHLRLVVGRKLENKMVTAALTAITEAAPPLAETTGSPVRTMTTARLTGRVDPANTVATYRFEYGDQGPCVSSPCASTPNMPAGSGNVSEPAAEAVEGLEANTTYHYRIVVENGIGGPVVGEDMTVATRSSDAPLSHGHFPGPPGSDRAYEMVSIADSSGNPVSPLASGFAANGEAATYGIFGGTPISNTGGAFSIYYAKRPTGEHPQIGWQTSFITPPRNDLSGTQWPGELIYGADDLSSVVAVNSNLDRSSPTLWRLNPAAAASQLFRPMPPQEITSSAGDGSGVLTVGLSADGSRAIAILKGGVIDPAYPAASSVANFYDVDSTPPRLISLLPGNAPAACGTTAEGIFGNYGAQASHFVSADGSLVYFPSEGNACGSPAQLYLRDLKAEETKLISGPPMEGPSCRADFLKATPGAAFFATATDLSPADTALGGCSTANNDVYRYDTAGGSLRCVTCVVAGLRAAVVGSSQNVSDNGSRVYFTSETRLTAGAPPDGTQAVYRVDVASGDLAFVAAPGVGIGLLESDASLSADGSQLVFRTSAVSLDPLGGASDNGGTKQYYLYNDEDRSLTCVSCPSDGSAPLAAANVFRPGTGQTNTTPLAGDGDFAFASATPLVGADQNTPSSASGEGSYEAGTDVYEWRDGRPLLVTSGLDHWSYPIPAVQGISSSGRDLFFTASAQYTQDALDANIRLYDARTGGGMAFPAEAKPCPLEVCQGAPKGAPEEQAPGSADFRGSGSTTLPTTARCTRSKVRRRGRCVAKRKPKAKKHSRRANANRRTHR